MSLLTFEQWFMKYFTKFVDNIDYNTQAPHHIWGGPTKVHKARGEKSKDVIYGRFYFTDVNGNYRDVGAHRAMLMFDNRNFDLKANKALYNGIWHVSHKCHIHLCVNPDHLVFEPQPVNNSRDACKNKDVCTGHDIYGYCLLKFIIHQTDDSDLAQQYTNTQYGDVNTDLESSRQVHIPPISELCFLCYTSGLHADAF